MSAQVNMSEDEFLGTLTGYDEIAIKKAFGETIMELAASEVTTYLRALIFVHRRREGDDDGAAKDAAMQVTLKACPDYFADGDPAADDTPTPDAADADLEIPLSAEGKGVEQPATGLTIAPTSA